MAKTQAKRKATVKVEPVDIYGNWKIKSVKLQPPTTSVGIKVGKSRFKIRNKGDRHVLQKKTIKKDVRWNGTSEEIVLEEIDPKDNLFKNTPFILRATVKLPDDEDYELTLGSKDSGVTLAMSFAPVGLGAQPGGTASAGRGG